jgi:hypothetical protein
MLLLYFLAAGLLLGRLRGGRLSAIGATRFHWAWLALGGLMAQVMLFAEPVASRVGSAGPSLYVASTVIVLAALLRNVRLPGLALLAVGAGLNLVAIVSNGGLMPSSPEAWAALTGVASLPSADFSNSALITPATHFPFLGDIFHLPRPIPFANVFSVGDVLIGLGAVWFLVRAMHPHAATAQARHGAPDERSTPAGLAAANR